jgi:outer membrane receptor protein involved in Fe transport
MGADKLERDPLDVSSDNPATMRVSGRSLWLLLLLQPLPASGQVITGSLRGTVTDPSGAALPETSVTLASPALLGGPSTVRTNARGQFRFLGLEPGVYRLELRRDGFAAHEEDGIRVTVGSTVEKDFALSLESVSESIQVTGETPLVDARESGVATNYTATAIRNTPVLRDSVYDFVKTAPGVSASSPTRNNNRTVSVLGAGINESTYLLDGTDITSPRYGISRSRPGSDIMEEIEIQSFGPSAEYGNLQGGVINVVSRQGGNDFRFDASYYGQWPGLTSQPLDEECNCPSGESGFERDLYRDFSAYLGGPILRDRLWFFGGFGIQWDFSSQPGADPRFPAENKIQGGFGKLNWQVTPSTRLMASFHYDRWSTPDRTPSAFLPYESSATRSGDSPAATLAQLTHTISANTLVELRGSTASFTNGLTPVNGSKALPAHFDLATGVFSGGALYFGDTSERKTDVRAKLSHYAAGFLESDHDFKFGAQFVVASSRGYYGYPGAVHYLDYYGQPFVARYRDTYSYGGAFDNIGVFAEDSVRVGDRLTLNLGLRFDYSKAKNPDVPEYDELGNETGNTIAGRGTVYDWSVFSPRLGVNLKLTEDARTTLRAFYGLFHAGILTTELQALSPGFGPITQVFHDPSTRAYTRNASIIDPLRNVQIDPGTRSPHTHQFTGGIDRAIGRDWALGLSYVRRTGGDFTGWEDIGGIYGSEVVTLPDGRPLTVFPLQNSPADRLFLLTNRDEYYIRYQGLLLTAQKRWADGWQLLLSYSYSEAEGLQSQNGIDSTGTQGSVTVSFNPFGRDPNDLTNAAGILPNDRTHMLRATGNMEIPRAGILVGANFQYLTGRPYAPFANVTLPQGVRSIYVEPLGSRRLSSQTLLDLRISRTFRVGPTGSIEILLDILNALDDTAEEGVATRNFFSPNFGAGIDFVPPRRAMIGAKFSF